MAMLAIRVVCSECYEELEWHVREGISEDMVYVEPCKDCLNAAAQSSATDEVPAWLCDCGRKHLKVHYGFTCVCGNVLLR